MTRVPNPAPFPEWLGRGRVVRCTYGGALAFEGEGTIIKHRPAYGDDNGLILVKHARGSDWFAASELTPSGGCGA